MSEHVYWIFKSVIQPGKLVAFKVLIKEMSAATKANENGALAYEWSLAPDGPTFHLLDHYNESAAAVTRVKNFGANFA